MTRKLLNRTGAQSSCLARAEQRIIFRVLRGLFGEYGPMNQLIVLIILKFFIFFTEPFDTAGRIDELLFSGKKRMAFGTDFNPNVLLGRSDLNHVAADTFYGRLKIIRMNVSFHCNFNSLSVILCIH